VAKILVADDNSNIQRMVGLALKDQGIDVVAVGNGEAAVRKISELRPDLVLADVFMPVRNGYEVCQYVKEDASLAHIPVILLVGAFDPLDEQEAQRVGADGILKKPFVPPDPLIAMVKAALDRAGVSLKAASATKEVVPQRRAADLLPKAPPPQTPAPPVSPLAGIAFSSPRVTADASVSPAAPAVNAAPVASAPASFAPVVGNESFVDEPAAPAPGGSDAAKHTMSFGSLLSPAAKEEEAAEDIETTTGSDWRSLDEPHDVREEEEEIKEAAPSAPSWRRDAGEGTFASDDSEGPVKDWRDSEVVKTAGRQSARETWEQRESAGGFVTAAEVPTDLGAFGSEVTSVNGASQVANTLIDTPETGSGDVAAEHGRSEPEAHAGSQAEAFSEHSTSVAVAAPEAAAPAVGEAPAEHVAAHEKPAHEPVPARPTNIEAHEPAFRGEPSHFPAEEHAGVPVEVAAEVAAPPETTEHFEEKVPPPPANNWFSIPASPWDTEARRANPLAASWETPKPASSFDGPAVSASAEESEHPAGSTNGASTSEEIAAVVSDEPAPQTTTAETAAAPEFDMDALAAKVLARLNPEMLQAITREVLKPVIAAILADELNHKK